MLSWSSTGQLDIEISIGPCVNRGQKNLGNIVFFCKVMIRGVKGQGFYCWVKRTVIERDLEEVNRLGWLKGEVWKR